MMNSQRIAELAQEAAEPCPKLSCPDMKSTYDGFDGERYRCEKCGKSIWLDYEDMR